jgi:IS30 family transposase
MPPIVGMVSISERPNEIENRDQFGHWEGDMVVGRHGRSFVATLVEWTTRMGTVIKLENRTAAHVAERLSWWVSTMPAGFVKTLTWDRGTELAAHINFSATAGVPVYFCDVHSPWQRGTNENWNGLLRQFLPRGLALGPTSQRELDHISNLLNTRPRHTLGWDTPAERFQRVLPSEPELKPDLGTKAAAADCVPIKTGLVCRTRA